MLQHYQKYSKEINTFLYSINANIDWVSILNKYSGADDVKLLKHIKSLIWTDKDIDVTDEWLTSNDMLHFNMNRVNTFEYYTKMISKYRTFIELKDLRVHILDIPEECGNKPPSSEISVRNENITRIVKFKLNVLKTMLRMSGIRYETITQDTPMKDVKILIPTASILYKDPDEMMKEFNGLMIPDGLLNIYTSEQNREVCRFKLSVLLLKIDQDSTVEELLNQQYGFIRMIARTNE